MTERKTLFLEGRRICDAEGNTVKEVSAEQRLHLLRMARMVALGRQDALPEGDAFLPALMESARQRVAAMSPEQVAELRARGVPDAETVREQAREEMERRLADMERLIPDSTTERIPLTP